MMFKQKNINLHNTTSTQFIIFSTIDNFKMVARQNKEVAVSYN